MHIDEWLDTPTFDNSINYAKFVLEHARMPAWKQSAFKSYMQNFKLFCTYAGTRYRCVGASRMGDIWLAKDHAQDIGYDLRVDVSDCSEWGDSA